MRIKDIKGYTEFKKSCSVELCEDRYPGWVGEEKYIITTDKQEKDLLLDFPELMSALSPYVIIGSYFKKLNDRERHNFSKHMLYKESSIEETTSNENLLNSLAIEDYSERICTTESLKEALLCLSEIQRSRVVRHFYLGLSHNEIARQDGVARRSVSESISSSIKILRRFFI